MIHADVFLIRISEDVVKDIRVSCNNEDITVTFLTTEEVFNGLIYPKGLSKNSSCMTEYINHVSYVYLSDLCHLLSIFVSGCRTEMCKTSRINRSLYFQMVILA